MISYIEFIEAKPIPLGIIEGMRAFSGKYCAINWTLHLTDGILTLYSGMAGANLGGDTRG